MRSSIKDVIKNFLYSFCSYALPLAVLQFVIQPIVANRLGAELNGQFLTLMSANYFLIGITAAVLNTVRMLQNKTYEEHGYVGDFNLFFLVYAIAMAIAMPIIFIFYTGRLDVLDILLYVLIGLLYLYHDYIFAQYRLALKYQKILVNNVCIVVGYFVGLPLFFLWGRWQIIIIVAYLFSSVYDFFNTSFLREPIRRTPLFKETRKKILFYTGSNIMSSFMTYCDKLLLYPLLGGVLVSVYTTASMVGKLLMLLSSPLNSVMLSYLVNMDSLRFKLKPKWILAFAGGCAGLYLGCLLVGYPMIHLLYPGWAAESQKFLAITVLGSLLGLIALLLNTVAIRFLHASFQIKLEAINLVVYLVCCMTLLRFFALWGFCIGVAVASLIRILILIFVIKKYIQNERKGENNVTFH